MIKPNFPSLALDSVSRNSAANISTGPSSSRRSAGKAPSPRCKGAQSARNLLKVSDNEFNTLEKAISDMDGYQCIGELHYYGDTNDFIGEKPKKSGRPQSTRHNFKPKAKPSSNRIATSATKPARPLTQKRFLGGFDDDVLMGKNKEQKKMPAHSF